ncbi:MAG: hypothetical protein R3D85_14830 [Paracoccaceae bacterium]
MRFTTLGLLAGLTMSLAQTPPARAETVLAGPYSITGGLCVGSDCTASEDGGLMDWLKIKGERPSLYFEDSSSAAGASTMDWWVETNGSFDHQEYFRVWGGGYPSFQITGGAPTNALFISEGGNIGLGTSLPQADIHITDATLASIRMEQTTAGGLAPGEWDIRANNGGFWIMDLTGDAVSTAFQIQQGVPHLAMTLDDQGLFGLGRPSLGAGFELWRNDGLAAIGITEGARDTGPRTLLNLKNNGRPEIVMANTSTQSEWSIGAGSNLVLKRGLVDSRSADKTTFLKLDGATGDMTIEGQLVTGGATCGAGCDAVFDPDYALPSIADHAAQMFDARAPAQCRPDRAGPAAQPDRALWHAAERARARPYLHRPDAGGAGRQQALNARLLARLDRLEAHAATDPQRQETAHDRSHALPRRPSRPHGRRTPVAARDHPAPTVPSFRQRRPDAGAGIPADVGSTPGASPSTSPTKPGRMLHQLKRRISLSPSFTVPSKPSTRRSRSPAGSTGRKYDRPQDGESPQMTPFKPTSPPPHWPWPPPPAPPGTITPMAPISRTATRTAPTCWWSTTPFSTARSASATIASRPRPSPRTSC